MNGAYPQKPGVCPIHSVLQQPKIRDLTKYRRTIDNHQSLDCSSTATRCRNKIFVFSGCMGSGAGLVSLVCLPLDIPQELSKLYSVDECAYAFAITVESPYRPMRT